MSNTPQKRKPGRPKASETKQTMEHILQTAAKMFMSQGYENVSLGTVASICQVTKASIYYYFHNKSELFTKSVVFVLAFANDQTRKLLNGEGSLQERLIKAAVGRMRNVEIEFETMMREATPHLTEEQIKLIRDTEQTIYVTIAAALEKAIDAGTIRSCDPLLATHLFTSMLTLRGREQFMTIAQSIEQAAVEIVDLFMRGLRPD